MTHEYENTKAQMRKGVLEFCILSVLQHGEAYTSDLLQTLGQLRWLWLKGRFTPYSQDLKTVDC